MDRAEVVLFGFVGFSVGRSCFFGRFSVRCDGVFRFFFGGDSCVSFPIPLDGSSRDECGGGW